MIRFALVIGLMVFCADALAHETGAPHEHTVPVLALISRWTHILSAIFMLGGTFFLRFVLIPVASVVLDETTHGHLRQAIRNRWKRFVHVFILLFLASGLYNYLAVTRFQHEDQPLYHALFGIKFLLALVIFALASMLVGRSGAAQKLQANGPLWLGIVLVLAVAVSMIGGYMKLM